MQFSLKRLTQFGTSLSNIGWLNRNIAISNTISLIGAAVYLLILIIHRVTHPADLLVVVITVLLLYLAVPFINLSGHSKLARLVLIIALLVGPLAITLFRKYTTEGPLSIGTFYHSRTAILVFSIIPLAFIHFKERGLLIASLAISFLSLFLFDPIHNALGLGFYQKGFKDPDYYYSNFLYLFIYLILIGCVIFLKKKSDKYEERNEKLIQTLDSEAKYIESQNEELWTKTELLNQLVNEKDKDLYLVTQELVRYNTELLQYSYTVSHHLRGPLTSILGLLDIFKNTDSSEEKEQIVDFLNDSASSLDSVIHELQRIVETRVNTFGVRGDVFFEEELLKIKQLLEIPIKKYGIHISADFRAQSIYSVKEYINFILLNLITNAIQYRKSDTQPEIRIVTYQKDNFVVLEVIDNGLGIDLSKFREKLFKPFSFFHNSASGKGIGLYIVKLHVEKLHGHIEVKSESKKGATFSVFLPQKQD